VFCCATSRLSAVGRVALRLFASYALANSAPGKSEAFRMIVVFELASLVDHTD
jgi:hypothetical protein